MVDAADESAGSKKPTKADEDIADIRDQVSSRTDPAAVARAARIETWADENFAAIRKINVLREPDSARLGWPRSAPSRDGSSILALDVAGDRYRALLQTIANPRERLEAAAPDVARPHLRTTFE